MSYHQFVDEDGQEYGSFEVIHEGAYGYEPGYYWWPCFPGCLPDGDPVGPFDTELAAVGDARYE